MHTVLARICILAAIALAAALPARAAALASFDCAKAASPVEHLLCDNAVRGHQDAQLAASYA